MTSTPLKFFFIALLILNSAHAAAKPGKHAVASAHPLATEAGLEILAAGGNAFDAAVAVAATLAVVEPFGSGIGGGGFFLLHDADKNKDVMIDARETAPLAANENMYLDDSGNVKPGLSKEGPLAAGIPGIPAALQHLAKKYGSKPLTETLAPAIRHAKEGFDVTERYRFLTQYRLELLRRYPETAAIFLDKNEIPETGYKIIQTDLGTTLDTIATKGAKGFYKGELAKKLVEGTNAAGGIWQSKDLSKYKVIERSPVKSEYRGMEITTAPLPSSGGIVLSTILSILQNYDLTKLSNGEYTHLIVEAMRRAYRDRAEYLGDSDFVEVPVKRLLSPYYAAGLAAGIRTDKATPSTALPGAANIQAGSDTTHFSVMDKQGNRVAATLSINFPFGSGFIPPGTGVLLNNEMDDFAAKPGVPNGYGLVAGKDNPNAIQPGKRMLSSMTPTFLEYKDRVAVLGTPGGSRIITMVLLATLNFHSGGNATQMVSRPRFHHQFLPDQIGYEPKAFNQNTKLELQLLGHKLVESSREYGNMQVIVWDKKQKALSAASDPRGEGLAKIQ